MGFMEEVVPSHQPTRDQGSVVSYLSGTWNFKDTIAAFYSVNRPFI
jgi:hypothetical protein